MTQNKDYMIRGIDKAGNFRFFGANTKTLVDTACEKHQTSPVVSAALGRTLTGAAMMGHMLKNDRDRVCIIIKGDGPIGGIVVEANGAGEVKGYAYNPHVDLPLNEFGKLDVAKAVGNAGMTVIKDLGLKEPYSGQVPMLSGEIAEDLSFYLVDKDCSIKQAGGLMIQVLPNAKDEAITALENKIKDFKSLTERLEKGQSIEYVLEQLLGEIEIMDRTSVTFKCDCSKERMERALITVGKKDLKEMAEEDGQAEIECPFCSSKYLFTKDELEGLIERI